MPKPYDDELGIDQLTFDPENPRLPDDDYINQHTEAEVVAFFDREYALDELGESMADNGYFQEEPLLVVPRGPTYRVIEGNRRLATLKLLLDPSSRTALTQRRREFWEDLAKQSNSRRLKKIPVLVYAKRTELLNYLGFRHISGVKEWKAEAKARYLSSVMAAENLDFRAAARRIGSTTPAVRRQVEAYAVLHQAGRKKYDVEPARHYFGLFYNALQDPGIRDYLGLPEAALVTKPKPNPVAETKVARVGKLLPLLFGDETRPKVIRESRQIKDLGKVLANATAREVLFDGGDLALALRAAGGDQEGIKSSLTQARLHLLAANGEAFKFKRNKSIHALALDVRTVLNELLKNLGA